MDIVMIGSGRSGTTIAARLLGAHPDLAWFSALSSRFPTIPWVALPSKIAALAPHLEARGWPRPSEAISTWDRYFPGFHQAEHDLFAADAHDGEVEGFRGLVDGYRRWQGKPHFFTKVTGWPRIEFLREVLPGVHLVHVERDPRAVAASMWQQGWGGRRHHPERFEGVDPATFAADLYMRFYRARAAHDWAGVEVLRYEQLVDGVVDTMVDLGDRLGLDPCRRFRRRLERFDVRPAQPWASVFDDPDARRLDELLEGPVEDLGYAP